MSQRRSKHTAKVNTSRMALTITHPHAAGIDIGSASHFVAVPPDRDDEPVREFLSFTVEETRWPIGSRSAGSIS